MKRQLTIILAAVLVLPLSSFALGFLTIDNVLVSHVEGDVYRLRVNMDWGGPSIAAEDIAAPLFAQNISDARVNLSAFELTGPASAFNYYAATNPSIWGEEVAGWSGSEINRYEYWQPLEYEFGFDFLNPGDVETLHLDFVGQLEWAYNYRFATKTRLIDWYDIAHYETIRGGYDVQLMPQVPEPSTLLLFGAGALGAMLIRRRKSTR